MFQDAPSKQSLNVTLATFPSEPSSLAQKRASPKLPLFSSCIHSQPFTQKLEIFFPVADVNVGYKLAPVMELPQKHFYAVKQSPMAFTAPETSEVLKSLPGAFYALSVGRSFDVEDVFAVYPNGEMILSLTKDTITSTGLSTDNKHSAHQSATFGPAMLSIAPSIVSISLQSNKAQTQVDFVRNKNIIPPVTFFLSVASKDEKVDRNAETPETKLGTLFPSLSRLLVSSERLTLRALQVPIITLEKLVESQSNSRRNVATPSRSVSLNFNPTTSENGNSEESPAQLNEEFVEDILEWVGAMHCRARSYVEGGLNIDPSISLVSPHAIERAPMQGLVFNHQGFITPETILQQLQQARSIVDAGMAPYAVLTAWAFVDQPLQHPEYFRDQYYTIIVLENQHYLVIRPAL
jgi:hypothetical protein